ncbi:MAG: hypothetical protein K2W85_08570 [Phycisphaerales bacterium]|nr:hypothetical protein [Phycisphaerales bacterium]
MKWWMSTLAIACVAAGGCASDGGYGLNVKLRGGQSPCFSSTPGLGAICVSQAMMWDSGWIGDEVGGQQRPFLRGRARTADGRLLTMICGNLSDPLHVDPTKRGVMPPVTAGAPVEGLAFCLDHQLASAGGGSEQIMLRSGFMHVTLEQPPMKGLQGGAIIRSMWPLIVRVRSIPAGAFGTKYVAVSTPNPADLVSPGVDLVLRPNQSSARCEDAGLPDGQPGSVVVTQPGNGSFIVVQSTPSAVRAVGTQVSVEPEVLDPDEIRFMADVCRFVDLVKRVPPRGGGTMAPNLCSPLASVP